MQCAGWDDCQNPELGRISEGRCTIAEMDYISFAMMYKYGGEKYGGKNIPVNWEAAELLIKL